jgi:deoxyadenosine/deoxycytidine kinase
LRFIAIEGVIGAGKTSLAKLLANKLHAGSVLEEFEDNPFLAKFYSNRVQYAFHTQVYFLLSRYRQQRRIAQMDLFNARVVSDYLFAKDRIFAEVNLTEDEFALYDRIYPLIEKEVPRPDLVVYLQSPIDILYNRIKQRDRSYEREIDYEYLEKLGEAYNAFFFHYNSSPLLIVNIRGFDFMGNPSDLDMIYNEIVHIRVPRKIITRE